MSIRTTFNLNLGLQRKAIGMALAAGNHAPLLEFAQQLGVQAAKKHPQLLCDADVIQAALIRHGFTPDDIGNAAGSFFKGYGIDPHTRKLVRKWKKVGTKQSERASRNGNEIKIWQLQNTLPDFDRSRYPPGTHPKDQFAGGFTGPEDP